MSNYTVTEPNMAIESSFPFIFNDLWTVYVIQEMTLEARKKACEEMNKMFGWNVDAKEETNE